MRWETPVLAAGLAVTAAGHALGLFVAPPEAMMGEVGRIFYAHVPTAWVCMLAYVGCFVAAVVTLWTGRWAWDAAVEATAEVGVLLNALLLFQGAVWGRPTWGVWWTWDPRLTTSAVMMVLFGGVLLLRKLVDQPERRLSLSSIAAIVAAADLPIVYFSVRWWNTLHQQQSSRQTVDSAMQSPLALATAGMTLVAVALVVRRWRHAKAELAAEVEEPALPDLPMQVELATDGREVR
ncbi:MAG: cytochrome c biogenesis protein CcsA [Myxococcota bacterium]